MHGRRTASAAAIDESRMSAMYIIKRRAYVCTVAAAFLIAHVLAVVADSATQAMDSLNLPGNARGGSVKIWSLLLLCGSALALSLLRSLLPELQPLLVASRDRSGSRA
jgi:hypothetical protein